MGAFKINNYMSSFTVSYALGSALAFASVGIALLIDKVVRKFYNGENLKDSNVALILSNDPSPVGITTMATLHWQSHTSIVYKDIDSIDSYDQAIQSIANNNNIITGLHLRIDSTPNEIVFHKFGEPNKSVLKENVSFLQKSLDLLAKNAIVTLHSKSANKTRTDNSCLAGEISRHSNGRRVITSSSKAGLDHAYVSWKGTSLKTRFLKTRGSSFSSKLFSSIINSMTFGYFGYKDTTVRFKSPD